MPVRRSLRHAQSLAVLSTEPRVDGSFFCLHCPRCLFLMIVTGDALNGHRSRTTRGLAASDVQANSQPEFPHVPRPRNAFIIYRSLFCQQHRNTSLPQANVSHAAGDAWRKLSEEEKSPYYRLAEREKVEHATKYPGYKYCPGPKRTTPKAGAATQGPSMPGAGSPSRSHSTSRLGRTSSRHDHTTASAAYYKEDPSVGYTPRQSPYQQVDAPFDGRPPPFASAYTGDFAGYVENGGLLEPGFDYNYNFYPYSYEDVIAAPDIPGQPTPQWDDPIMQQEGAARPHYGGSQYYGP